VILGAGGPSICIITLAVIAREDQPATAMAITGPAWPSRLSAPCHAAGATSDHRQNPHTTSLLGELVQKITEESNQTVGSFSYPSTLPNTFHHVSPTAPRRPPAFAAAASPFVNHPTHGHVPRRRFAGRVGYYYYHYAFACHLISTDESVTTSPVSLDGHVI